MVRCKQLYQCCKYGIFSYSMSKRVGGSFMEKDTKLIGLFVARTFEENNLNFIHALHDLGAGEGYKLVIFSLDTTVEAGLDSTPAEEERRGGAECSPRGAPIL